MKKQTLLAAVLLASASFAPSLAYAQSADAPKFITSQAGDLYRVKNFIGQPVMNEQNEKIGDINDILFDQNGQISVVVLGVGGFLGVGEKHVALPYEALKYETRDGARVLKMALNKADLQAAPAFVPTEKTQLEMVREKAGEYADKAKEKASELKDKALQKYEELRQEQPKTN